LDPNTNKWGTKSVLLSQKGPLEIIRYSDNNAKLFPSAKQLKNPKFLRSIHVHFSRIIVIRNETTHNCIKDTQPLLDLLDS
jgi:hypothetical protein